MKHPSPARAIPVAFQWAWLLVTITGINRLLADPWDDWQRIRSMRPRGYPCLRASSPIHVDGRLDDPAWRALPWTEDFTDIQGPVKPRPLQRTRAKLAWDDQYLYVAALLEEQHVWGKLTERDAVIFQDNDFEVFIDPDGDGHDYYEFEINALNTVWDLRLVKAYRDGGPALNEWTIDGLRSAVHVDGTCNDASDVDRSWSVEIAFPWSALARHTRAACPPNAGDRWAVNFSRVEWQVRVEGTGYQKVANRPEDNWVWSPTGIIDMHRPEKWGIVEFRTAGDRGTPVQAGPLEHVRDRLHSVYYAQAAFRQRHQHFAVSIRELRQAGFLPSGALAGIRLNGTPTAYEASCRFRPASGAPPITARIRHDGQFLVEHPPRPH